jgi:aspartate aminotransferase
VFFEAIERANLKGLDYTHSAGTRSFREKLAAYYRRMAPGLTADDVLTTTSGSEAIRFAMMTCLDPGDEVLVIEPTYANYKSFALEAGATLRALTSRVEDDFALPPVAELAAAVGPRTRALLLCNPSNPTGKLYSPDELEAIRQLVQQHGLYLFSDEAYGEFVYDGLPYTSALALAGIEDQVLVIDTLSKRYSACGSRIGALITRNRTVWGAALKFAQARLSPPTLGQIGGEALLELPDSYYAEVRAEYARRRDFVLDALRRMPGVVVPQVSGAFYVMPKLPIDDSDRFCQWLLESFDHQGRTVMLAPATGFYITEGLGKQEVRLAYVLDIDDLAQAMDCLAAALEVYPGRTR